MIPAKFNKLTKPNKSSNKVRIYKAGTNNLYIEKINEYNIAILNSYYKHQNGVFTVDGNYQNYIDTNYSIKIIFRNIFYPQQYAKLQIYSVNKNLIEENCSGYYGTCKCWLDQLIVQKIGYDQENILQLQSCPNKIILSGLQDN